MRRIVAGQCPKTPYPPQRSPVLKNVLAIGDGEIPGGGRIVSTLPEQGQRDNSRASHPLRSSSTEGLDAWDRPADYTTTPGRLLDVERALYTDDTKLHRTFRSLSLTHSRPAR